MGTIFCIAGVVASVIGIAWLLMAGEEKEPKYSEQDAWRWRP